MRGLYSHSANTGKYFWGGISRVFCHILRGIHSVRIHAAPVFAPARIQENISGELFMYWFRARGYFSDKLYATKSRKTPGKCSLIYFVSTSAQGPTQWGPIQKQIQGQFLQFFFPSPHEAAVFLSATVAETMCGGEWVPLLKCLILMVAVEPSHDHDDCLMWTGPQWAGPPAAAYSCVVFCLFAPQILAKRSVVNLCRSLVITQRRRTNWRIWGPTWTWTHATLLSKVSPWRLCACYT